MPTYIMTPYMFNNLKNVSGFTGMNGETYSEHICILFDSQLSENQKEKIKSEQTPQVALDYLGTIVEYTHDYDLRTK